MRTANPALSSSTFTDIAPAATSAERMTIEGTVHRTALLLAICLFTAAWMWQRVGTVTDIGALTPWMIGAALGGFAVAIVTVFKKQWAAYTGPLYAALEGVFLGAVSAFFEMQYPGIVVQAVALTFGTLACLLLAYRTGLIKVTENFRLGVFAATGAIMLIYLVSFALSFFGIAVPYIHGNGIIGIIFSLVVVGVAALNLVLDFDFIEQGAAQGAPKYMEWYAAFGLIVTLVWLYLEILRLLAKLQSRD